MTVYSRFFNPLHDFNIIIFFLKRLLQKLSFVAPASLQAFRVI